MIFHFCASSSTALGIQTYEWSWNYVIYLAITLEFESSRRVSSCEKISQVALAAFPRISFLTFGESDSNELMQYLFIIFLIVLSLLPFMFAFPSFFIHSIHIEKVSFCITNYMPFRFSICFSCTEEIFRLETFFILLLAAS